MHPSVLFSLVWFIILLMHFIFSFTLLNELFPLTLPTYFIFFIGVLAFSFGSFIEKVILEKNENKPKNITHISATKVNFTLRCIILGIAIVGLPFYIEAAYRVFLASHLESFFGGLRTELAYGDEDIGPVKYLTSFSFVVFAIELYAFYKDRNRVNKLLVILSFLIALTYAIFVTGRTLILMLLAVYIGISYILNKRFSIKKIAGLIVLFMIFFVAIGIMYGKGGDTENTAKENVLPASQGVAIYLVTSLNALDLEMNNQFHVNYDGNNSLRFFMKIGEQFGWIPNAKVNELIQPFALVPYPTNVYTVYSPYIKDFGILYAWFMLAIFGLLHTWLYNKALSTKNIRFSLYYSFLLFPLLISFFMDFYLTISSLWIQIIFFIEIILKFNTLLERREQTHTILIS